MALTVLIRNPVEMPASVEDYVSAQRREDDVPGARGDLQNLQQTVFRIPDTNSLVDG